jgi:hypothetical protein
MPSQAMVNYDDLIGPGAWHLQPASGWQSPPEVLTITVESGYALYCLRNRWQMGSSAMRPEPLWGGDALDGNTFINGLHEALDRFRVRFTEELNSIEDDVFIRRLKNFQPQADWESPPKPSGEPPAQVHLDHWKTIESSDELRTLADFGYQVYQTVFRPRSELRGVLDALSPGALLEIHWQRNTMGRIPNLPWPLMYVKPPPPQGQPIEPHHFLGLRHRIKYEVEYTRAGCALGDPGRAHRMHCYYWDGDAETLSEAKRQHSLWRSLETYHSVPCEPGCLNRPPEEARAELIELLRQPPWDPLGLIYIFCQGDVIQRRFSLYFSGAAPMVSLSDKDISSDELKDSPLVFVNACKAGGTDDATVGNPLEKRFLDRGCRAYVAPINYIPIRLASRFAQAFFHFFLGRPFGTLVSAGEAVAQTRRFLWQEFRNIGGLYYSYVNNYDLYLADQTELDQLRPR